MTLPDTRLRKVLVANRGEIARRIFRTLREMGIPSVGIFSDADRDASWLDDADEAVRVGPAASRDSYLNQEAIVAAARAVGADAVHPGYGFLAENADFVERCDEAGLIFIGPSAEAVRYMGDKGAAKALAKTIGVPVVDGFEVNGDELEHLDPKMLRDWGETVGFPLLVKAMAGGGGKGMRRVESAAELDDALAAATREAESAFGDGGLLVEHLVEGARHVEIQVLVDGHGHAVHLFERDCSIQRRHQKVFEEAPSPAVDADLRQSMGEAAVALARAAEYEGVGTVEFLLAGDGSFTFLEMNTRLQVEHPVTELVTGLDLVRLQIEVAEGRPLPFEQDDLAIHGHAIEARLYAEDPSRGYLPSTGRIALWSVPERPGLRVDAGVAAGDEVSPFYDPMLAKVIAHGRDRAEAVRRLRHGLAELAVGGPATNRDLLIAVLDHEAFRTGQGVDTAFLEERFQASDGAEAEDGPEATDPHAVAAALHLLHGRRVQGRPAGRPDVPAGWGNARRRPQEQRFEVQGASRTVRYVDRGGGELLVDVTSEDGPLDPVESLASPSRAARLVRATGDGVTVELDGVRRRFRIGADGRRLWVHGAGRVVELHAVPRFPERESSAAAGGCVAPMTGKVVAVRVAEGDTVSAGDPLVILEAMKMEHQLNAHADGTVTSVRVEAGQMVDPDEVMVVVTPADETEEDR